MQCLGLKVTVHLSILILFSGDPEAIAKIHGRNDVNYLKDQMGKENLQLLNLM